MSQPAISLQGVSKTYRTSKGEAVEAVRSVSLEVREGEFVCMVGHSGCGKTTLLRIISGLTTPTKGEVTVLGERVSEPSSRVGLVFQNPTLMPWRRVWDNVLLPAELLGRDRADSEERARGLLETVGLTGFENVYPRELSGGMQQRVSLARALVHDPPILLMDEPFGSLDELTREEMAVELLRITQAVHKTVVFVTHSLSEAVLLGDRVIVLSPRPSTIWLDLEVDAPRPRDASFMSDPSFLAQCTRVRQALRPTAS